MARADSPTAESITIAKIPSGLKRKSLQAEQASAQDSESAVKKMRDESLVGVLLSDAPIKNSENTDPLSNLIEL